MIDIKQDWASGYVSDVGYTYGYYTELNPEHLRLAFLRCGYKVPKIVNACELGFGQGVSVTMHSAASSVHWFGTDFNPTQSLHAQQLVDTAGLTANLSDEAFAEFVLRPDLPTFDFIGLHGIWSWISDDNRAVLVDFIRRKLSVGGVLYISYNTFPGWAAFSPMRQLMMDHVEVVGAEGRGTINRINDAIEFANRLLTIKPQFAISNPVINGRIEALKDQNRHYLAHEYFNRDWRPMHFSTMAGWLSPAKLEWICSANPLDQIDKVNLSEEQISFLNQIQDSMFRESVRDFVVDQQFRRDYWAKGVCRLTPLERRQALLSYRVILTVPPDSIAMHLAGTHRNVTLRDEVYVPIIKALSDHKPHSLEALLERVVEVEIDLELLVESIVILSGPGYVKSAQSDEEIEKHTATCQQLNLALLTRSLTSGDITFLASPVTGGGIPVGRINQIFLMGSRLGLLSEDELSSYVWKCLQLQDERLLIDGIAIDSPEKNIEQLKRMAKAFRERDLAIYQALFIN